MISKKIMFIVIYISVISSFLILSMASNNSLNIGNQKCNSCHGLTATGHVDFTVTLTGAQTVETGVVTVLTATMRNNNYQLDTVSIALEPSSDYSLNGTGSLSINVGNLARGSTQVESWKIVFHSSSDRSTTVKVDFTGRAYATSHMQYTYQHTYSKSIFITTTPRPILQVDSNPLPESTLWVHSSNNTGQLVIKNAGKVDMPNVSVVSTGPVKVDGPNGQSNFTIADIPTNSQLTYKLVINTGKSGKGTVTVSYQGEFLQESVLNIYLRPNPADSFTLFLGRVFGYLAYILLFISVVAGAGIYHLKKYISGRKIRILHSDLANLSFTMVIIHAITLSIPNSPWSNTYYFYELLPERIPTDIGTLGLALGRSALVLMYIAVFSGFYLSKLIKRYGKRVGISIHMLSYVALIFGFIHTILIGGWAKSYPIIGVILFVSVLSVGFLKWDAQRLLNSKKKNRAKRIASKQVAAINEPSSLEQ